MLLLWSMSVLPQWFIPGDYWYFNSILKFQVLHGTLSKKWQICQRWYVWMEHFKIMHVLTFKLKAGSFFYINCKKEIIIVNILPLLGNQFLTHHLFYSWERLVLVLVVLRVLESILTRKITHLIPFSNVTYTSIFVILLWKRCLCGFLKLTGFFNLLELNSSLWQLSDKIQLWTEFHCHKLNAGGSVDSSWLWMKVKMENKE